MAQLSSPSLQYQTSTQLIKDSIQSYQLQKVSSTSVPMQQQHEELSTKHSVHSSHQHQSPPITYQLNFPQHLIPQQ